MATINSIGSNKPIQLSFGGTNANLTASNGGIFYSTASAGAILSGTATARQMLQSGSSTTPAWSTATWPATTTINQLLYSSATSVISEVTAGNYGVLISSSTGVPSWLANGTTGQLLTATTAGTPSWGAAAITTINGDTGSITGTTVSIKGLSTAGASVAFTGSGTAMTLATSDVNSNTFIGAGSGNASVIANAGAENAGCGVNTLNAITSGSFNASFGATSMANETTGSTNAAFGYGSLTSANGAVSNCSIGAETLTNLATGAYNIALGAYCADNYSTTESSNIVIGYNNSGTVGESNVLRIGSATGTGAGELNAAYISGIFGSTTDVSGVPVVVDSSNLLGTIASSVRYKENIYDMLSISDDIHKLRPVVFNYKKNEHKSMCYGLIAEEVQEVMPNIVVKNNEGQVETVKYLDLIPMLLNEVQKLRKELNQLKERL